MHTLNYNPVTNSALCSCRMVLVCNCSQAEAEQLHRSHVDSQKVKPTAHATVRLAQVGRSAWSGFSKSEA